MKILITGAAGFIGSHLVDALAARGDDLVLLDNLSHGRMDNLARHRQNPRIHFINGDLRNEEQVNQAIKDCSVVYHLGAQSDVVNAVQDLDTTFQTNVVGTYHILKAAREQQVQCLVFPSSREVYGEPHHLPVDEDQPLLTTNAYGASKISAEMYCRAFRKHYGLPVVILRMTNVYGTRDRDRVIPVWIKQARACRPLPVFGGQQVLDFIWIDTVIQALISAAQHPELEQPINIGSGTGTPILDLARRILELTNSTSELSLLPPRDTSVLRFVARVERMRDLLGIHPPKDPLEHLPDVLERWDE
ncbi:MAG TPA: SDR family NAD(P)-dependent oxidoreductase [Anaerolineaceae bacterium]|jgi:UDP-glucose 4-epimerase|nr:SDR family NAD(P)-dependent oxidoreductase [Longilinea sp.]NMD31152.1 SDR family NAD(P)-dependent oxidoreductase [Chloroflexota bacterium]HNZ00027.1 SDR family NAD(P)-dependent oxidoreductase [Anaerolineaceae bacterium]HOD44521.1 SDR family NAD(P)-dependent oxidoreductase [Anaerolineaceae bacterium]HOH19223.1 SDR family NAD(P)-dependent oxidoreductase [Anaerolineaceae bacterium]